MMPVVEQDLIESKGPMAEIGDLQRAAPSPQVRRRNFSKVDCWILSAITALTLGLYLSSFPKEFTNWDDPEYIINNPLIRSLSLKNLNTIITEPYFANYAPLTLLSYALDYQIWELNPLGYHLHNLALHLGCILTLYGLLCRFDLSRFVVLGSVLLFAIHPVNVETVSWASERKNLLATLFFLLCFYHYIRFREERSRVHYLSAVLFFLLSILSKASTVVAPLAFLAYDYLKSHSKLRNLCLYDKLPFIVLAEIHTFLSIHAAGARNALRSYHGGGSLLSTFASGHLFEEYLGLLFWPIKLSAMYDSRESPSFGDFAYWLPLILFTGFALSLYLKSRRLFFWLGFFVIFLIPVLNIVPLPIKLANRYLYIPQIGIWVTLGIMTQALWRFCQPYRMVRSTLVATLALWLVLLTSQTWRYSQAWKNIETLWSDEIDKDFLNEVAHYNLGLFYVNRGLINRAGLEFGMSLGVNPNYHLALSGMGGYYYEKGRIDLAKRKFYAAINSSPDFDIPMNNLGKVYAETGDLRRALFMFHRATYANPKNIGALNNIVVLYLRVNRPDAAKEVAMGMIKTFPEAPDGFFRLGMCLEALGDFHAALNALENSRKQAGKNGDMLKQIDSRIAIVQGRISKPS
jgi:tetratricopeptide (TPR) repeat protein